MADAPVTDNFVGIDGSRSIILRAGGYGTFVVFASWEGFTGTIDFDFGYIDSSSGSFIPTAPAIYATLVDGVLTQTTAQISETTDDNTGVTYVMPTLGEFFRMNITLSAGEIGGVDITRLPNVVMMLAVDNIIPAE